MDLNKVQKIAEDWLDDLETVGEAVAPYMNPKKAIGTGLAGIQKVQEAMTPPERNFLDPNKPEDVLAASRTGRTVDEVNKEVGQTIEQGINWGGGAMGIITPKMLEAYQAGRQLSNKYKASSEYWQNVKHGIEPNLPNDLGDYIMLNNDIAQMFEIGFKKQALPPEVVAWRYGDIPKSGYSYNYRDSYPEAGTSVMQVKGRAKAKNFFELFEGQGKRKKVYIRGHLLHKTGSEGEPLLIQPKKISRNEYLEAEDFLDSI